MQESESRRLLTIPLKRDDLIDLLASPEVEGTPSSQMHCAPQDQSDSSDSPMQQRHKIASKDPTYVVTEIVHGNDVLKGPDTINDDGGPAFHESGADSGMADIGMASGVTGKLRRRHEKIRLGLAKPTLVAAVHACVHVCLLPPIGVPVYLSVCQCICPCASASVRAPVHLSVRQCICPYACAAVNAPARPFIDLCARACVRLCVHSLIHAGL